MSMDPGRPRTPKFFKRFEIFFGRLFLAIGGGILLIAPIVFPVLRDEPGMGSRIWAFLISPLTLGVILLAVGACYLRRGLRQARKEERLLQVGTTTEATITSIEQTSTRVNRHPLWRAHYAFDDLHGTPREGQSSYLSEAEAQSYQIGEQVCIRYDPEQPSESIWLGRDELTEQL
jgi:Protein of unknown function (DUF3592)